MSIDGLPNSAHHSDANIKLTTPVNNSVETGNFEQRLEILDREYSASGMRLNIAHFAKQILALFRESGLSIADATEEQILLARNTVLAQCNGVLTNRKKVA